MGVAAVPAYLSKHLPETHGVTTETIAPGHRFSFLFPIWNKNGWVQDDKGKTEAVKKVVSISKKTWELIEALSQRQAHLSNLAKSDSKSFEAISTAPFITGIGNEHPLENGFSFLSPYGLPYLPASAVKGTLRRAAENLALGAYGERGGWEPLYVWLLFGFEGSSAYLNGPPERAPDKMVEEIAAQHQQLYLRQVDSNQFDEQSLLFYLGSVLNSELLCVYKHQPRQFLLDLALPKGHKEEIGPLLRDKIHSQGACVFWDVYPRLVDHQGRGELFKLEILTPHHSAYYQHAAAPADCEQPLPNPFLTVAPGCRFIFNVSCEPTKLPPTLREKWRGLLETAFDHTFAWLGFGAKTAVGYGQMQPHGSMEETESVSIGSVDSEAMSGIQPATARLTEEWTKATLNWKKNEKSLTATHHDGVRKTAPLKNPDRSLVPDRYHKKLFDRAKAVTARVFVSVKGNHCEIVSIEPEE